MPSKKNAFIAILIVLLKKENKQGDRDINVKAVIKIFKASGKRQDFKPSCGTNMFGKSKPQNSWQMNVIKARNGSDSN